MTHDPDRVNEEFGRLITELEELADEWESMAEGEAPAEEWALIKCATEVRELLNKSE